ncbi:glycosyltransferase [Vibrio cyclitrophicus]
MLFVVAPFESENICKDITSRNLEIIREVGRTKAMLILSDFDHRYKKRNCRNEIKDKLERNGFQYAFMRAVQYQSNISLKRVLSNFVFSLSLFFFLLKTARRDDRIFINAIPPEIVFFCSIIKLIKGVEVILDVRDIWPDALVNLKDGSSFKVSLFKLYCTIAYLVSLRCVDRVSYVAPSFLPWLSRWGLNKKRHQLIPLGFDEVRWQCVGEVEELVDRNCVNLVYIGYLSHQFDLTKVIEAVSELQGIKLHVIGGGANYENMLKAYAQNNSVVFYGMRSPKWISTNARQFDIGVLPLRQGGGALLPNKFFDYLAAELPILSYGSPDVRNIVDKNGVGWSVQENKSEISKALSEISLSEISIKKNKLHLLRSEMTMQKMAQDVSHLINNG